MIKNPIYLKSITTTHRHSPISMSYTSQNMSKPKIPSFSPKQFRSDHSFVSQVMTRDYFQQDPPNLPNDWKDGSALRSSLRYLFHLYQKENSGKLVFSDVWKEIGTDLERFSDRCLNEVAEYGDESEKNPPKLRQYDGWGRRIDVIDVAKGWEKLHDISAEEGLVSIAYERKFKAFSRVYQFAKMNIFVGSSAVYGCPLSMGDGGARLIEVELQNHKNKFPPNTLDELRNVYRHLTSRSPSFFWTSGQWMTEKTGGSDVARTETHASKVDKILNNHDISAWSLTGYKFFTSATTSEVAFALGRIVYDENFPSTESETTKKLNKDKCIDGSRGLSVFLIKLRDNNGKLQNIHIHKLKDKLGTKAVPTAELELNGAPSTLVSQVGRGVPSIATMFNITRIHNSIHATGSMRRAIMIVRDYAQKRYTFGKKLSEHPLFLRLLSQMETTYRGNLLFTLELALLQGKHECSEASENEEYLLRLLTPLMKLYTAKEGFYLVHECVEALGGLGYMEDATILPRLLRDVQVGTIWEGATNIMALDLLRALSKNPNGLELLGQRILGRLKRVKNSELENSAQLVLTCWKNLMIELKHVSANPELLESGSREFSFGLTTIYISALLLDCAESQSEKEGVESAKLEILTAKHWIQDKVPKLLQQRNFSQDTKEEEERKILALDYETNKSKL